MAENLKNVKQYFFMYFLAIVYAQCNFRCWVINKKYLSKFKRHICFTEGFTYMYILMANSSLKIQCNIDLSLSFT